jgi:hypothetical protein
MDPKRKISFNIDDKSGLRIGGEVEDQEEDEDVDVKDNLPIIVETLDNNKTFRFIWTSGRTQTDTIQWMPYYLYFNLLPFTEEQKGMVRDWFVASENQMPTLYFRLPEFVSTGNRKILANKTCRREDHTILYALTTIKGFNTCLLDGGVASAILNEFDKVTWKEGKTAVEDYINEQEAKMDDLAIIHVWPEMDNAYRKNDIELFKYLILPFINIPLISDPEDDYSNIDIITPFVELYNLEEGKRHVIDKKTNQETKDLICDLNFDYQTLTWSEYLETVQIWLDFVGLLEEPGLKTVDASYENYLVIEKTRDLTFSSGGPFVNMYHSCYEGLKRAIIVLNPDTSFSFRRPYPKERTDPYLHGDSAAREASEKDNPSKIMRSTLNANTDRPKKKTKGANGENVEGEGSSESDNEEEKKGKPQNKRKRQRKAVDTQSLRLKTELETKNADYISQSILWHKATLFYYLLELHQLQDKYKLALSEIKNKTEEGTVVQNQRNLIRTVSKRVNQFYNTLTDNNDAIPINQRLNVKGIINVEEKGVTARRLTQNETDNLELLLAENKYDFPVVLRIALKIGEGPQPFPRSLSQMEQMRQMLLKGLKEMDVPSTQVSELERKMSVPIVVPPSPSPSPVSSEHESQTVKKPVKPIISATDKLTDKQMTNIAELINEISDRKLLQELKVAYSKNKEESKLKLEKRKIDANRELTELRDELEKSGQSEDAAAKIKLLERELDGHRGYIRIESIAARAWANALRQIDYQLEGKSGLAPKSLGRPPKAGTKTKAITNPQPVPFLSTTPLLNYTVSIVNEPIVKKEPRDQEEDSGVIKQRDDDFPVLSLQEQYDKSHPIIPRSGGSFYIPNPLFGCFPTPNLFEKMTDPVAIINEEYNTLNSELSTRMLEFTTLASDETSMQKYSQKLIMDTSTEKETLLSWFGQINHEIAAVKEQWMSKYATTIDNFRTVKINLMYTKLLKSKFYIAIWKDWINNYPPHVLSDYEKVWYVHLLSEFEYLSNWNFQMNSSPSEREISRLPNSIAGEVESEKIIREINELEILIIEIVDKQRKMFVEIFECQKMELDVSSLKLEEINKRLGNKRVPDPSKLWFQCFGNSDIVGDDGEALSYRLPGLMSALRIVRSIFHDTLLPALLKLSQVNQESREVDSAWTALKLNRKVQEDSDGNVDLTFIGTEEMSDITTLQKKYNTFKSEKTILLETINLNRSKISAYANEMKQLETKVRKLQL